MFISTYPRKFSCSSTKNVLPQPELNNWTKVSCKRSRSTKEETEREAKHTNKSEH
jgi:hypothetical protein